MSHESDNNKKIDLANARTADLVKIIGAAGDAKSEVERNSPNTKHVTEHFNDKAAFE